MPKSIRNLLFGPAGVPNCSEKKDTISGIKKVKEIGLDCMEMEFVYGVRIKDDQAEEIKKVSEELNVVLTAHGPYYINLNAKEKSKAERSIKMIVDTAKICYLAGGWSITFHPAWYMRKPREEVYRTVKENLKKAVKEILDNGYDVWIRPETMEMTNKFGDLDEVIRLSLEIENVLPCIDFAHLRYRFGWNSEKDFRYILERIEKDLGKEALKNMHIHISGIKLDKKGTHVNLEESDMKWKEILKILKEFGVEGVIISESPNLEEDAILMKNYWKSLEKD